MQNAWFTYFFIFFLTYNKLMEIVPLFVNCIFCLSNVNLTPSIYSSDSKIWGLTCNRIFLVKSFYTFLYDCSHCCSLNPDIQKGYCRIKDKVAPFYVDLQTISIEAESGLGGVDFSDTCSTNQATSPNSKK